MADNRKAWDAWREAEDARPIRRSVQELHNEGYEYYKQADRRRAASLFRQAAETAAEQGDVDGQCENLSWEGHCWYHLGRLKQALERLLRAESLGGGDAGVRFWIVDELSHVARLLPLPRAEQEELLKKLAPYKGSGQIGGSRSAVLWDEMQFQRNRGNLRAALDRAQEAFASRVDRYPFSYDGAYYRELTRCYRENGLLPEARNTLRDWRAHGSTRFANVKSRQFRAEAQILHAERRLGAAWDAIRRCQAEERYLRIYGQDSPATLTWLIRIAADAGRLDEARPALPLLFRWHDADSLYAQYDCFYWFAYYYAALAARLCVSGGGVRGFGASGEASGGGRGASGGGGVSGGLRRYDTPETARRRAARWYSRAERVGRELDALLETDVKRKELDTLREKLALCGAAVS